MLQIALLPLIVVSILFLPVTARGGEAGKERVFIVKDYRYVPGKPPGDADTGHSLCGTRCDAISFDYLNVIEPGGWRVIKVADNIEKKIELGSPFMAGQCICVGDEYDVRIDDLMISTEQRKNTSK